MEKSNKNILFYLLVMMVLYQLHSCQKLPANQNHELFLKTFANDSGYYQYGYFIEELNDRGFIIISIYNSYPLITRTDKYGSIISQRVVLENRFNITGGFLVNFSTTGDPWHFLGQAGRLVM